MKTLKKFFFSKYNKFLTSNRENNFDDISKLLEEDIFLSKEPNDLERTIKLLKGISSFSKEKNRLLREHYLKDIDNLYYRAKIVELIYQDDDSIGDLIQQVLEFNQRELQLNQILTEEGRTKFIIHIPDNIAKIQFLRQIKEPKNRDQIINSLTHKVDPDIKPYVDIVTEMIQEFFDDIADNKMDPLKKEKMRIVFNRTNIEFGNIESYGKANMVKLNVIINNRIKHNPDKIIAVLIHEYGHQFSRYDVLHTMYVGNQDIEEGTQDLFEEMVINHYIKKHGSIEINGRKIRMSYPYISFSGYEKENAIARTILYQLSLEKGKAEEAFMEYELGDKNKYWEMAFGKENAKHHRKDAFGHPDLTTNWREIYEVNPKSYENINLNSMYCRRNYFIPVLELINKFGHENMSFFDLKEDERYSCAEMGEIYFKKKKLYQISRDDMERFRDLYDLQCEQWIANLDDFVINKIDELTEDEIQKYSFEILNTSLALCRDLMEVGLKIERVWIRAVQAELNEIRNGQPLPISVKKYQTLIPEYLKILRDGECDATKLVLDAVKDLQFEYIQQIEALLEQGKKEEVLEALKNKHTGELFLDDCIMEVLERFGINIGYNIEYSTEGILTSAERGNIKLDDVSRARFIFEARSTQVVNGGKENVGR